MKRLLLILAISLILISSVSSVNILRPENREPHFLIFDRNLGYIKIYDYETEFKMQYIKNELKKQGINIELYREVI